MDVLLGGPEVLADLHAHAGMNMLAVVGPPVDPAADFNDAAAALIAPTVAQPAYRPPVRDLISLLLRLLPDTELRALSALAAEAGGRLRGDATGRSAEVPDEDGNPVGVGRVLAAERLGRFASDTLDEPLDIPLFFINPFERKAATQAAVEEGLAAFRDRSPELADALRERTSPDKSLSKQFAAWDAREGWAAGTYSVSREQSNKKAAVSTGAGSESSASDAYENAFKCIFGVKYTAEDRFRLHAQVRVFLLPPADRDAYLLRNGKKAEDGANRARRSGGTGDPAAKWITDAAGDGGPSLAEQEASCGVDRRPNAAEGVQLGELRARVRSVLRSGNGDVKIAKELTEIFKSSISPADLDQVRETLKATEEIDAGGRSPRAGDSA